MYNFRANVFDTSIGSSLGKTVTITVVANDKEDAYKEAKKSFDKYIHSLEFHHNIDVHSKLRKTIHTFAYNNLELCL